MCLTLPNTLISLAGIDKVIPRFEDLDVFFQVLPRSATGERMNPYNSIWTGVTPNDGPQNFHVVLIDNGRSSALDDRVGREALRCIRCAACLNVCPVYEQVGGHAYGSVYPGPIGAILTPQLNHVTSDHVAKSLPYASTLCGACFDACPVRIDIPKLLVHLRGEVVNSDRSALPKTQEQLGMRAASWIFARPSHLRALTDLGAKSKRLARQSKPRPAGMVVGLESFSKRAAAPARLVRYVVEERARGSTGAGLGASISFADARRAHEKRAARGGTARTGAGLRYERRGTSRHHPVGGEIRQPLHGRPARRLARLPTSHTSSAPHHTRPLRRARQ